MKELRTFFTFYGGKWRAAPRYPEPLCKTILEPFAGSAGYSLRYPQKKIILNDLDPVVAGVWDYLIRVSESEILALPTSVSHVDEIQCAVEAKHLIGFWLNKASATPCKQPSKWLRDGWRPNSSWGDAIKLRISSQLEYIRHWRIYNESYERMLDQYGTWFVDPPYEKWGHRYKFHDIDYLRLADWCHSRQGQLIACEQDGANWLPFTDLGKIKATGRRESHSKEVFYTSYQAKRDGY